MGNHVWPSCFCDQCDLIHPIDLSFRAVHAWKAELVALFMIDNNLGDYENHFIENDIDGTLFMDISHKILKEIGVERVGPRYVLYIVDITSFCRQLILDAAHKLKKCCLMRLFNDTQQKTTNIYGTLGDPMICVQRDAYYKKMVVLHDIKDYSSIMQCILNSFNIPSYYDPSSYSLSMISDKKEDNSYGTPDIKHILNLLGRLLSESEVVYLIHRSRNGLVDLTSKRFWLHMDADTFTPITPVARPSFSPFPYSSIKTSFSSNITTPLLSPLTPCSPRLKESALTERPPSDLISSNLSTFFPDLKTKSNLDSEKQLQRLILLQKSAQACTSNRSRLSKKRSGGVVEMRERSLSNCSIQSLEPSSPIEIDSSKWVKGKLIGKGSFGSVFLGLHTNNGTLMAVKQVELNRGNYQMEKKEKEIYSLKQEIAFLMEMQHTNIVRYIGSNVDESFFNIFLEYVPGGSVSSLLSQYGPFEEKLVQRFTKQILSALCYLHDKHIIHRDIKAGNILIDNHGVAKLSDFGLSKKLVKATEASYRKSGLQGSVFWMAPESVKYQHYTAKSDMWSLGCTMIEMIKAERPYGQINQMQALYMIGSGRTPEYDVSMEELGQVLDWCLMLKPERRPNAEDLLQHAFFNSF